MEKERSADLQLVTRETGHFNNAGVTEETQINKIAKQTPKTEDVRAVYFKEFYREPLS